MITNLLPIFGGLAVTLEFMLLGVDDHITSSIYLSENEIMPGVVIFYDHIKCTVC